MVLTYGDLDLNVVGTSPGPLFSGDLLYLIHGISRSDALVLCLVGTSIISCTISLCAHFSEYSILSRFKLQFEYT